MISKVVTNVHLLNLQRVIVKCMHMDSNSQWMPLPGHTCPHTRQTRPRRSCRSAPASPGRLHWPGGSRQRSWPSSGGWCRGWRGAPSGRTWACCGSWSTGHRGYKLLEWVTHHKMCHSIEPFFFSIYLFWRRMSSSLCPSQSRKLTPNILPFSTSIGSAKKSVIYKFSPITLRSLFLLQTNFRKSRKN